MVRLRPDIRLVRALRPPPPSARGEHGAQNPSEAAYLEIFSSIRMGWCQKRPDLHTRVPRVMRYGHRLVSASYPLYLPYLDVSARRRRAPVMFHAMFHEITGCPSSAYLVFPPYLVRPSDIRTSCIWPARNTRGGTAGTRPRPVPIIT